MNILKKLDESILDRKDARDWFINDSKRNVSLKYDYRETQDIQKLSIETFLAYYKSLFNNYPNKILDIGCGKGETFEYLQNRLKSDLKLVGIDSSAESIKVAKNKNIDANFIQGDIEKMSFDNFIVNSFDVIFIHLCFSLFIYPYSSILKLIKLMSHNSLIYIVDLNPKDTEIALETARDNLEKKYLIDQYKASLSKDDMERILQKATNYNKIKYHIGTSYIGGFNMNTQEFSNIISQKNFVENLPTFNSTSQKAISSLNSWIIKTES
ncbi:ubiquinone/menaquinone biosynthesis C-methylase UbiE [Staphylococcus hominis]